MRVISNNTFAVSASHFHMSRLDTSANHTQDRHMARYWLAISIMVCNIEAGYSDFTGKILPAKWVEILRG